MVGWLLGWFGGIFNVSWLALVGSWLVSGCSAGILPCLLFVSCEGVAKDFRNAAAGRAACCLALGSLSSRVWQHQNQPQQEHSQAGGHSQFNHHKMRDAAAWWLDLLIGMRSTACRAATRSQFTKTCNTTKQGRPVGAGWLLQQRTRVPSGKVHPCMKNKGWQYNAGNTRHVSLVTLGHTCAAADSWVAAASMRSTSTQNSCAWLRVQHAQAAIVCMLQPT